MTSFDDFAPASSQTTDADSTHGTATVEVLSDEAALRRLYELATGGANDSAEFARLDELVYRRLMDTYERGGGTAGVIHMGARRAA